MNDVTSELIFCYKTVTRFSTCVMRHDVLLRCLPAENVCQQTADLHITIPSAMSLKHGNDAFGNRIQYGAIDAPHDVLAYISTGIVKCRRYRIPETAPAYIYSLPSRLTMPSDLLRSMMPEKADTITMAERICHGVHEAIDYSPMTTTVNTPAQEAALTGKGVCQDMAHIMITLCRLCSIPARYVNGFVIGTGQTHAWVEIWHRGEWIPFDPTHDVSPANGYIKIAHGRDAFDCPVCRGTYIGTTCENTEVCVTVEKV